MHVFIYTYMTVNGTTVLEAIKNNFKGCGLVGGSDGVDIDSEEGVKGRASLQLLYPAVPIRVVSCPDPTPILSDPESVNSTK